MSLIGPNLEAFLAVVKHKTVHQAAAQIGLTQTGVTQRIKSLESTLATTLFIRSRKGMRPTEEGEALLRYCHTIRDLEGETLARIQKVATKSPITIRITGHSSIMRMRVIPSCAKVQKKFENLFFHFDITDASQGADKLRSGEVHFAIIQRQDVSAEMDSKLLKKERYVLAIPTSWEKRPTKEIIQNEHIVDFDPDDKMTFNYLKKYELIDIALTERHFANNTDALSSMLALGIGYSVLTEEFAEDLVQRGLVTIKNRSSFYDHEVALSWYPRPQMPAYFHELIKAIK